MDDLSVGESVRQSVCPVHCGKTADRIPVTVWRHRSDGPGMRQVVGFGDRPTGRGTFGGEFGARHCNQWAIGTLRRTCATVPQPSELRFGVVRAVGRGIAVLDGTPRRARGRGCFGGFVPHFHNGKCHRMPTVKCFRNGMRKLGKNGMRKLDKTYRWKARFVDLLVIYSVSRSKSGLMRN